MTSFDDLNFSLTETSPVQRSAYRAMVRGLFARLDDGSVYDVHDISAGGCSLAMPLHAYQVGYRFILDLLAGKTVLVTGIEAEVVRLIPNSLAACAFLDITRYQEIKLDKLVLEIQKRKIAQRKNLARESGDDGE